MYNKLIFKMYSLTLFTGHMLVRLCTTAASVPLQSSTVQCTVYVYLRVTSNSKSLMQTFHESNSPLAYL